MKDWRSRAEVWADVVFFAYHSAHVEQRSGEVFVWDLDKTYLDTKFESLGGLIKVITEKPQQKRNVPGTVALVRSLRDFWKTKHTNVAFPIYFITASPPQLENRIIEKLHYDEVEPFGLFCKDNLQNLRPKRLWRLTQQIGFKLQALLQLRLHLRQDVRQIMWGDDSESDAVIYALYSDICARRISETNVRHILRSLHVIGAQLDAILALQDQIPPQDPVAKIYINLAEDTDSEYYEKFGRRTVPTFNSFQTALDLHQDERLFSHHVIEVAEDLIRKFGFTKDQLERSLDDLVRRQVLGGEKLAEVVPLLKHHDIISAHFEPSMEPVSRPVSEEDKEPSPLGPWVPESIDYLHDYR